MRQFHKRSNYVAYMYPLVFFFFLILQLGTMWHMEWVECMYLQRCHKRHIDRQGSGTSPSHTRASSGKNRQGMM